MCVKVNGIDTLDVTHIEFYTEHMIIGFADKDTEALFNRKRVRGFSGFEKQGLRRLDILDAAISITDLKLLPSNRFEALGGKRKGQFSIRINAQWRICFQWPDRAEGPTFVEIVDYH